MNRKHSAYKAKAFLFKYPKRTVIQIISFAVFVVLVFFVIGPHWVHTICPIAFFESPLLSLLKGTRIFWLAGIILGASATASTIIIPRPFCGWVCPVGFVADIFGELGERLHINAKKIPHWLNERMRYFSYGVLIFIVIGTIATERLFCILGCPVYWSCNAFTMSVPPVTLILLLFFVFVSLRVRRGFCRYICPFGALMGVFVPLSRYKVRLNLEVCKNCYVCRVCPMGIDITRELTVKSSHCISCNECVLSCPLNALYWGRRNL